MAFPSFYRVTEVLYFGYLNATFYLIFMIISTDSPVLLFTPKNPSWGFLLSTLLIHLASAVIG